MSMYENVGLTSLDYIEEILHLRKALADISDECSKAYDKIANFEQQRWVSVKDRLPEGCETVLICNANKKFVASGYYSPVEKRWNQIGNRFLLFTITHWMPLPEPPESEE